MNFGQTIDLSEIDGDIGLSTKTQNQLCSVDLQGAEVVTIENLLVQIYQLQARQ